jgi:hypothetical protein
VETSSMCKLRNVGVFLVGSGAFSRYEYIIGRNDMLKWCVAACDAFHPAEWVAKREGT